MSRTPSYTVFVGNIPYDVTESELKEVFGEIGPVKSIRVVTDKDTGRPKGYAFCEFYDRATAESCVRNLNSVEVSGRSLRVDYAEDHSTGRPGPADRDRDRDRDGPRGGDRGGRFDRDGGPRGPYGPPTGLRNVGVGTAEIACEAMADSLGSMAMMGGPAQETINAILGGMAPMQLFEVAAQVKTIAQSDPAAARQLLASKPSLTRALYQAQILLGLVKKLPSPDGPPASPPPASSAPSDFPTAGPPPMAGPSPLSGMPPAPPLLQSYPPATGPPPPHLHSGMPGPSPPHPLPPQSFGEPLGPHVPQAVVSAPAQQALPALMPPPAPSAVQATPPPATLLAPSAPAMSTSQQGMLQQLMKMTPEQVEAMAIPEASKRQAIAIIHQLHAMHAAGQAPPG
mmetsp:Transcript_636/g.1728  ORF Transcript_636/g.1728 Transcript_636/m.1728 type:complete len:398 (-) Transcript_636:375-1568(-)